MRDTEWNGRWIAERNESRGVNTAKIKADEMHEELKKFDYFSGDGIPIVEVVLERRYMCLFISKFHCE